MTYTLLSTVDATGSTTVSFNWSNYSTSYKSFEIRFYDAGHNSTGSRALLVGHGYPSFTQAKYYAQNNGGNGVLNYISGTTDFISWYVGGNQQPHKVASGVVTVHKPYVSALYYRGVKSKTVSISSPAGSYPTEWNAVGVKQDTQVITSSTFYWSSSTTFTSGTFKLFGVE